MTVMPWYLNVRNMWRTGKGVRDIWKGGGPGVVRLEGFSHPEGWILPSSRIDLAVVARDGRVVEIPPHLPLPPLATWGYRIAHRLGVPIVSSFDPEKIGFDVKVADKTPGGKSKS